MAKQTGSIPVHLPLSLKAEAGHLADKQGLSLSAWVRGLIFREVEAQKEKRERIMNKRRLRAR